MDVNYFKKELAHILETSIDNVSMEDELDKFETWDSLAMMTFVVFFRDKTVKELDPMKVSKCLKVSNLLELLK